MGKRYMGTYDAHRTLRSSSGRLDMDPNDEQLELMRIASAADVRNATVIERYRRMQRLDQTRKAIDRLR